MNYGFVKTACATPVIRVADCDYNKQQIIDMIVAADKKGIKLAVFPELCITGYSCGDLFLQKTLLDGAENALADIINATREMDIVAVVGLPLKINSTLYNCAAVIQNGVLLGVVPKTNIPNYSEFYEQRHFTSASTINSEQKIAGQYCPFGTSLLFRCDELPEFCFGVEICEDLWVADAPSVSLAKAGATVIVNLSASNETVGKQQYRRDLVKSQSARLMCAYLYADAGEGESTTDAVFSGHCLIAENGTILAESELFSTGFTVSEADVERMTHERTRMNTFKIENELNYDIISFSQNIGEIELTRKVDAHPFVPENVADRNQRCESILAMQSHGLKKRIGHINCKTVAVGISGGLDSALALLVAVKAMDLLNRPRTDIIAVTMPCFGTTGRTKSNAQKLCEALGVTFKEVNITSAVKQHFSDIGQDENNFNVTFENAQARERTQVLMDIANMTGGIVVGTGDLSELALGWATYNGDHMSMYGVNASIPKTLVRYLVKFVADTAENDVIASTLNDILDTPVSPELIPADGDDISQKTEDIVGPYELHDFFLYNAIRFGFTPPKIYFLAKIAFDGVYDSATILKWLKIFFRRFFAQQFKRSCMPDGPKVGSVTLSPRSDWRMPSDAVCTLWMKEIDNIKGE